MNVYLEIQIFRATDPPWYEGQPVQVVPSHREFTGVAVKEPRY